ncbi:hypothetical protein [Mycobacterium sp.]|uniref:hypothetical protein n=1 Tax=Mycobacterium sp. TaxID=1785 RepID=UPI003D0E883E
MEKHRRDVPQFGKKDAGIDNPAQHLNTLASQRQRNRVRRDEGIGCRWRRSMLR